MAASLEPHMQPGQHTVEGSALPSVDSFFPQRSYIDGAQLCFLHIQKTAGTTVRLLMENAFAGTRVFPTGSHAFDGGYLEFEPALAAGDDFRDFEAFGGHNGAIAARLLPEETNRFVWLREPFDRGVSAFFFFAVQERTGTHKAYTERLDLGERIESVFLDWADREGQRLQSLLIAGRAGTFDEWRKTHPHVDVDAEAVAAIRQCFFVGLMEDQERSIDAFCALTSILPPKQDTRKNVGTKRRIGLSFTPEEQARLARIYAPQFAFCRRMTEIYHRQMDMLRGRASENPALALIGRREELRQYILGLPKAKRQRRLATWNAWDPVQGENLDSREQHRAQDGGLSRWRWTGPSPDTYLYVDPPRKNALKLRLRLNRATPIENAQRAELFVAGHRVPLRMQDAQGETLDLVGEIARKDARRLPDLVEIHIHTPAMMDEGALVPYAGTRKLGLALESLSFEPVSSTGSGPGWFRMPRLFAGVSGGRIGR